MSVATQFNHDYSASTIRMLYQLMARVFRSTVVLIIIIVIAAVCYLLRGGSIGAVYIVRPVQSMWLTTTPSSSNRKAANALQEKSAIGTECVRLDPCVPSLS
jgi:heme O synthase-like polyprenyltransferase